METFDSPVDWRDHNEKASPLSSNDIGMKFTQSISLKTGLLALTFAAIASTGGLLASCANTTQSQVPNTSATDAGSTTSQKQPSPNTMTDTGGMQGMDHSSMNHNMAMDLGPADANYDLRFIDAMRLHHRGAIAMAQEAQQKSQRPEIRKLAENIIQAQSREENELLRRWRQDWYPNAPQEFVAYGNESKPLVPMSEQQQQSMTMREDLGPADAEFDLRFMNAMIAHHEGALMMAQDALAKSQRPEIKKLAQEIIDSQQAEIAQMKQWQQAWYKQ